MRPDEHARAPAVEEAPRPVVLEHRREALLGPIHAIRREAALEDPQILLGVELEPERHPEAVDARRQLGPALHELVRHGLGGRFRGREGPQDAHGDQDADAADDGDESLAAPLRHGSSEGKGPSRRG
jgi:hypothetical protein